MKKFLIIYSPSKVNLSGNRLIVKSLNSQISIPVKFIQGIVLLGDTSLSSKVLGKLLKERVPLYFLSKYGKFKGILFSEYFPSNSRLRLSQYSTYQSKRLEVAKFFVYEKAKSIEETFQIDLSELKEKLSLCKDLDSVLGIEGNMSLKRM